MNLADAIRRAAQTSGASFGTEEDGSYTTNWANPEPSAPDGGDLAKEPKMKTSERGQAGRKTGDAHAPTSETQPGHNVVRLELVLNPEQLKGFFGAVIASQHSVLTLREAAGLLRVAQGALERMAQDGNVPGMMVDGKWRFTRQALEDWVSAHPTRKEA